MKFVLTVDQKIDIAIKLQNKERLVDSELTRQQYTVHKIFYVRTFAKYRRIADFNDFPNFRPPVVEKVEESDRRFLAVW